MGRLARPMVGLPAAKEEIVDDVKETGGSGVATPITEAAAGPKPGGQQVGQQGGGGGKKGKRKGKK